ncbi:MAG: hypothetical protein KDB88_00205 [Flavobacteriales bacterium]|nr:hypothetical protein [Flavobacteriales bacterium]
MILSAKDLSDEGLALRVIADISCDVDGPIASTLRATTIDVPFYWYDRMTGSEVQARNEGTILVMSVDNLPCELPRDASEEFSADLLKHVLPQLVGAVDGNMIDRATIARNGELTDRYGYLADYASGKLRPKASTS